jgi:FAD-dependent urate hydroxylase
MPAGMILKSEPMASNLWDLAGEYSLERFSGDSGFAYRRTGDPLKLDRFLAYADWFRKRTVPNIDQAFVTNLRRDTDRGFVLSFAQRSSLRARKVVIATGQNPFARTPECLARLPAELASHSIQIDDPRKFAGRDVAIVGLGQSALEIAALLFEAGASVRIFGRGAKVAWNGLPRPAPTRLDQLKAPDAGLGEGWESWVWSELPWIYRRLPEAWRFRKLRRSWGPAGAWWLENRVVGKIPVSTGVRIEQADEIGGRVRLRLRSHDGGASEAVADHVVACTGFELDFERLPYIDASLRPHIALRGKAPLLSASFETTAPGLYAIGLPAAPTFGPSLRFMYGAKFAARTLARSLAMGAAPRRAKFSPTGAAVQRG